MSWKPRFDCMPRFLLKNYDPIKKGLIIKPYERQKYRKNIYFCVLETQLLLYAKKKKKLKLRK